MSTPSSEIIGQDPAFDPAFRPRIMTNGQATAVDQESLVGRAGGWFPGIAGALGLFALTRLAQLAILGWMTPGVRGKLLVWDAGHFMRVAEEGYPLGYTYNDSGELVGNGLAFFPLYPGLIRLVTAIGVDVSTAAIAVAWVAGAAAALAVYLLGTSLYDRRTGYALLVLVFTQPMSVVFSLAYSEGLFLALVAGALVAAHRRVWPIAGIIGLGAALTRPTGLAAGLALAVAALLVWRGTAVARRRGGGRERWAAAAAAAFALVGVPTYLLWVGLRVGDLDAWFRIQTAGWGSSFDYGASVGSFLAQTLRDGEGWVPVSVAWLLVAAVVAAVMAVAGRVWSPLVVYGLLMLVLVLGQAGYYHSKPRLLVPVLLVLVPAAVAAARAPLRMAVPALLGWAAFGLWYGAYMVAVWPYTI